MKRLVIEIVLGVLAVAGAAGTWWMWNKASVTQAALISVSNELEAGRAAIESMSEKLPGLQRKANELDAVRAALASGVALSDIEAAARTQAPSAERALAQGAVRMLTKGSTDAEVRQLFEKALELVDWNSRLKSLCAAQAGLIASGQKIEMLADCRTLAAAEAAAAAAKTAAAQAAAAPAAPAGRPGARPDSQAKGGGSPPGAPQPSGSAPNSGNATAAAAKGSAK